MKAGRWGGGRAVRGCVRVTHERRNERSLFSTRASRKISRNDEKKNQIATVRKKPLETLGLIYERSLKELQTLLAHKHVAVVANTSLRRRDVSIRFVASRTAVKGKVKGGGISQPNDCFSANFLICFCFLFNLLLM